MLQNKTRTPSVLSVLYYCNHKYIQLQQWFRWQICINHKLWADYTLQQKSRLP